MKKHFAGRLLAVVLAMLMLCGCVGPSNPTDPTDPVAESWLNKRTTTVDFTLSETTKKNQELAKALYEQFLETPPIDFLYDGKQFSQTLDAWDKDVKKDTLSSEIVYTHRETKLAVILTVRLFEDSSAVEWSTRLRNDGSQNSLIVQDLHTMSLNFETKGSTKLFYTIGGEDNETAFVPHTVSMKDGDKVELSCKGGRSSSGVMPYFNLYTGKNRGYIGAIGWSGQWSMQTVRNGSDVQVTAGMSQTRFYLEAGESVMAPSSMLVPWEGDSQEGHNDLRRHLLYHHTLTMENGELPIGPISYGVWGGEGSDNIISQVKAIANRNLGYDILWIDAGWNGDGTKISHDTFDSAWGENVGTWDDIKSLYPNGMMEVSQFCHEKEIGMLLWFEPERAFQNTELVTQYPEWFLGVGKSNSLFNLGDEEACAWLTQYIAGLIKEYGVDIYRQDFNIEPLSYWQQADGENRQGITEMKYIEGLYRFWDGLLEQCPGLIIDNCASGGRRLDFELLGRSIVLFRSDYACYTATANAEANQMQIYGSSFWLPLSGTSSMGRTDSYNFRSTYGFSMQTPNIISKHAEQLVLNEEFKKVREYYYGDYYPLTECTTDETGWFAYQMNRTDWDSGFVCAFRRLRAEEDTLIVKLSGLRSDATYKVTISDTGETFQATGQELMQSGLSIRIERTKDSRVIFYEAA